MITICITLCKNTLAWNSNILQKPVSVLSSTNLFWSSSKFMKLPRAFARSS